MKKASLRLLCTFILAVSAAELFTGLSLSVYWIVPLAPAFLVQFIYETYSRYYIVLAILTVIGGISGFIGAIVAWRKFSK